MLVMEPNGLYAGWVNVWGDWAAHLSYATSFGYGSNFNLEMPLLAGAKFSYPFLADWFSGMLMKIGIDMILAMLVPSLVLSMLLVASLLKLGEKIVGGLRGGIIVSLLFLFNGGLGFWWFIKDAQNAGLVETLSRLPREYTHLEKLSNIEWINIISSQVIPQRGFLMGFPIALVVYYLLWQAFESRKKVKGLFWAGVLTGVLPLIQAHSFVLVGWVAGWLMVMEVIRKKKISIQLIKEWSWFWLPMVLIGLPQVLYFYGGSLGQEGFISWQPGWMAYKDGSNIIWFWVKNLGFSLGLAVVGMRLASNKLRKFSLPFWGLFLIANLWIFQPWKWDNTKIFTHWYLVACILGAVAVVKGLTNKNRLVKGLVGVVLCLSLWSGFLDAVRLTQYKNLRLRFFDNQELMLADWVKKNTDEKARFLTAGNHDHWVPVLTGRKIVLGFKGWLWTYGLDYSNHERAVDQMFEGKGETLGALEDYEVDYVVIGPKEKYEGINQEYYEDNFKVVYKLGGTRIFKVRNFK